MICDIARYKSVGGSVSSSMSCGLPYACFHSASSSYFSLVPFGSFFGVKYCEYHESVISKLLCCRNIEEMRWSDGASSTIISTSTVVSGAANCSSTHDSFFTHYLFQSSRERVYRMNWQWPSISMLLLPLQRIHKLSKSLFTNSPHFAYSLVSPTGERACEMKRPFPILHCSPSCSLIACHRRCFSILLFRSLHSTLFVYLSFFGPLLHDFQ